MFLDVYVHVYMCVHMCMCLCMCACVYVYASHRCVSARGSQKKSRSSGGAIIVANGCEPPDESETIKCRFFSKRMEQSTTESLLHSSFLLIT